MTAILHLCALFVEHIIIESYSPQKNDPCLRQNHGALEKKKATVKVYYYVV